MQLDILPAEIISHVFLSLPTLSSVTALASTCHYLHEIYHKQRLAILTQAIDSEFGPIDDIVQVITANRSQPAHIRRDVPMSEALLKQVLKAGRVAQKWEEIYPFKKWKVDFAHRRSLNSAERHLLRRAVYRLWLFTKAFHNRDYVRTCRNFPDVMGERATLLHNWTPSELAQMWDVHHIFKDMIANNVCPSNSRIRQKFQKRYPESNHQLLFNIHLNYPVPSTNYSTSGWMENSLVDSAKYTPDGSNTWGAHQQSRLRASRWHEPGAEGWGDDINHYYIVEDMMKLDPEQILFVRDMCPLKAQVEAYLRMAFQGGEWFMNNGETFSETLGYVIRQRGGEMEALKAAVEDGELGVALLHS